MASIDIGGVTIAYQLFGQGVPFILTGGGWGDRSPYNYMLAGCLSADHSVLMWDRRNSKGTSDVALSSAQSEWHQWTDDLHEMLHALDLAPAYLCGISAGHVCSLLMAHRYPEDVKGLVLLSAPTDDVELLRPITAAHYLRLAELAESQGMQQVITESTEAWIRSISGQSKPEDYDSFLQWVAETIQLNPGNREKILALDPMDFAATMRRWGNWFASDRLYSSGLSDEELRAMTIPALIIPGGDDFHPPETARRLFKVLPNTEWVDLSEHISPLQMEEIMGDPTFTYFSFILSPIIRDFINRIEAV